MYPTYLKGEGMDHLLKDVRSCPIYNSEKVKSEQNVQGNAQGEFYAVSEMINYDKSTSCGIT